jgi:hypothetical protein
MAFKIIPDSVRECFSYDPETGVISRIKSVPGAKYDVCETLTPQGYLKINHRYTTYQSHRVAWFLFHGEQPDQIDHINRNRSDNRLCNLRNVNRSANQINNDKRGIFWVKSRQKWLVTFQGKHRYAGRNIMLAHFHRYMAVTATHSPALPPPSE